MYVCESSFCLQQTQRVLKLKLSPLCSVCLASIFFCNTKVLTGWLFIDNKQDGIGSQGSEIREREEKILVGGLATHVDVGQESNVLFSQEGGWLSSPERSSKQILSFIFSSNRSSICGLYDGLLQVRIYVSIYVNIQRFLSDQGVPGVRSSVPTVSNWVSELPMPIGHSKAMWQWKWCWSN